MRKREKKSMDSNRNAMLDCAQGLPRSKAENVKDAMCVQDSVTSTRPQCVLIMVVFDLRLKPNHPEVKHHTPKCVRC